MRTKLLAIVLAALSVTAQERIEVLNDFESWTERSIKESAIIGGKTKTLYKPGGVWGCSNAYAKVMGVEKVSVSVTPEKRGNGTCCRMRSPPNAPESRRSWTGSALSLPLELVAAAAPSL